MLRSLERYRADEELGRGAWGVVHRAEDPLTGELLALKRCLRREVEDLKQLKQEFRRVRGLRHPNLVRLFELVVDDEEAFFTMEYIPGRDLDEVVRELATDAATRQEVVISVARQLIEAVVYLHEHDVLHRDLKPSNVRVTPEGRVVVLDFGLSASPEASRHDQGTLVGSTIYLAPECLLGAAHSRTSDAFGVGMLLWMLASDVEPFPIVSMVGNLRAKRRGPGLPSGEGEQLLQIGAQLLDPAPERRPSLDQVLERLGVKHVRAEAPFIGRTAERTVLEEALRSRDGAVVHVHGPPGIGKSRLVEEALRSCDERGLEVLRARCHPDETVPFRALDGIVDELTHLLWRAPAVDLEAVQADARAGLMEIFAVFGAVPGWTPKTTARVVDARERRRSAARGLAQIVELLAAQLHLVLWVDDLQWGDGDSDPFIVALLEAQTRATIILSYRWPEAASTTLEAVRERAGQWKELALPPLRADERQALVVALGCADVQVRAGVEGRPGWIEEVARLGPEGAAPRSMNGVVQRRAEQLSVDQRELLELVLLEHPMEAELLLRALRAPSPRRVLDELEATRWVRRTSAGLVDTWHDRIGDALAPTMDPGRRRAGHAALAQLLLSSTAPRPRRLATHLEGAGRGDDAIPWYERAADEAREQLAFERAAEDYAAILRLDPEGPWSRWLAYAEVLDLAGRSAEAGQAFLKAARRRGLSDTGDRALRLRAGTRLLYGGQLDEGRGVLTTILADVGVSIPSRPLAAGLLDRLRLVLRGTRFSPRSAAEGSTSASARARALIDTAGGLFMVAPIAADALAARGLREALDLGDTELVISALGFECSSEANIGGAWFRRRSADLLDQLQHLAQRSGETLHIATATLTHGTVAFFNNRWGAAASSCRAAYLRFLHEVPGTAHQQNAAMAFHVAALGASGRITALREALTEYRGAAEARGDLYAQAAMATAETFWPDLADDAPERALARAQRAMAAWPARDFSSPHYQHAFLEVTCLHYIGEHRRAERRLEEVWPDLRRHGFLGIEWLGHQLRYLRGRVALACAAERGVSTRQRILWRRRAGATARALGRSPLPAVVAFRTALAHGLGGRRHPSLSAVAQAFTCADMPAYAAAARLFDARARGEDERPARGVLADEGVQAPLRLASALLPVIGEEAAKAR